VPLQELSSFSRLTDCDSFARQGVVETYRREVSRAGQVGALSDGAEWIQGFVDFHRPDAIRILDFPHAGERVGAMGAAVFGEGTAEAKVWLSEQLHCLKHQGGSVALAPLRSLAQTHATVADLSKPLAYLEKREAQMAYPAFRAAGWPIGSGAVESANKLVMEARLKGAGMLGPLGMWTPCWPYGISSAVIAGLKGAPDRCLSAPASRSKASGASAKAPPGTTDGTGNGSHA
jgi:hypothetical protein